VVKPTKKTIKTSEKNKEELKNIAFLKHVPRKAQANHR